MDLKRYCENCRRNVIIEKDFNGCLFVILLLLTFFGGLIYLLIYGCKKPNVCPYCHRGKFLIAPIEAPLQQQPIPYTINFCSNCGRKSSGTRFCEGCGYERI